MPTPSPAHASRAAVVRWPARADLRAAAAEEGRACLLVVEVGADLPVPGELEDWIRSGSSEADVAARLADLDAFSQARGAGARRVAELPSVLAGEDRRLTRILLARAGSVVPRTHLADPRCRPDDLDRAVVRVRRALAGTSWRIARVADHGYVALQPEPDHR